MKKNMTKKKSVVKTTMKKNITKKQLQTKTTPQLKKLLVNKDVTENIKDEDIEIINDMIKNDVEEPETDKDVKDEIVEEKRGLASKDSLMLYFEDIRKEKILTQAEEKDYIKKAQSGNVPAREKVIRANLKLVVKIARRYDYLGVPIIDLIEEGNIGLMKALEKFKPAFGFRFSTYATWWIKQSVNRAIANQKNTIRIPVHILDIYHKYLKLIEKEIKDTGRFPEKEDVAKKLGIEPLKLYEILNIVKTPKSLDMEYENEDSDNTRSLKDTTENLSIIKPDDDFFEKDKNEKILELVSKLKPKEQEVIMSRFGINNRNVHTLEEIGAKLKLTRERIRQIEVIAIKKLKNLIKNSD
ncbi:MAG: sigma-70 family RNA polymerase sigma factor [bacterium]